MLGLDISCKQLGDDCKLKGIMSHLYIHFDIRIDMKSNSLEHFTQLEAFVSIVYIMPTIRENISWWNIYIDNGYILPTLGG